MVGDLSGRRDLIVEGRVEADAELVVRRVTIGATGFVIGDIHGSSIFVEGRVEGNLVGDERVVIRRTAEVRGNVTAPRIDLESGARLQGSIETSERRR